MICPVCAATLATVTWESDVRIEQCPRCRGTWLEAGELERLEKTSERPHPGNFLEQDWVERALRQGDENPGPARQCPCCAEPMDRREYGGASQILIDVCAKCEGVWLDRGELDEAEDFFEETRKEVAREDSHLARFFRFFRRGK